VGTIFQFPYRTVAEISLRALVKNLATLRARCKKEVIPVVKADAYGHGMLPIAKALVSSGCAEMLAVATLEEAIELRKKFPQSVSILVLSGFLPHQVDAYLRYHLVPVIHSLPHLKSLLGRTKLPSIHLKVDSGMNRLGILPEEVSEAARVLSKLNTKLDGLMTHFADSEVTTSPFIDQQIKLFETVYSDLREKKLLATDATIHTSNTGAIIRGKVSFSTAVRPGLGLYGILPNPRWQPDSDLTPVLEWRARILCLKSLKRGATVGYGRTYKANKKERIALLPIGYADGYPRLLSEHGEVLIHGRRLSVRGRVSMDLTAVDCSHVPGAREGMVVTLIGKDGKETISAWDVAQWAQTIPYEVLCGISSRVPRVYYG
jgi:alanine racemase